MPTYTIAQLYELIDVYLKECQKEWEKNLIGTDIDVFERIILYDISNRLKTLLNQCRWTTEEDLRFELKKKQRIQIKR